MGEPAPHIEEWELLTEAEGQAQNEDFSFGDHKSLYGHDAGRITDLGVSSLRESFMGSEEAKSLVDRRLKKVFFMPNFVLSHTPKMSVVLNLVDSVQIKGREIKEVESAEHLELANTSTLPSSDMTENTSAGFFLILAKRKGFCFKKQREKEKRMSVTWIQRKGRCGRCRSKAQGNLSPSLSSLETCSYHHDTG